MSDLRDDVSGAGSPPAGSPPGWLPILKRHWRWQLPLCLISGQLLCVFLLGPMAGSGPADVEVEIAPASRDERLAGVPLDDAVTILRRSVVEVYLSGDHPALFSRAMVVRHAGVVRMALDLDAEGGDQEVVLPPLLASISGSFAAAVQAPEEEAAGLVQLIGVVPVSHPHPAWLVVKGLIVASAALIGLCWLLDAWSAIAVWWASIPRKRDA